MIVIERNGVHGDLACFARLRRVLAWVSVLGVAGCGAVGGSSDRVLERLDEIDRRLTTIEARLERDDDRAAPTTVVESSPAFGEGQLHDFGIVWSGEPIEHAFVLRNDGDAPLAIRAAQSSCSCLEVVEFPRRVEPGEEARVGVLLDTRRLRGALQHAVTVRCEEPGPASTELAIVGQVRPSIEFESFVVVRARPGDGPKELRVPIRNARETPLELRMRPPECDGFDVELVPSEDAVPGTLWELVLRVAPPYEIGYRRCPIVLDTDLPDVNEIEIRAHLHVPERLEIVPRQLVVPAGSTAERPRALKLTNWGDAPVRVLGASVDDPAVSVGVTARDDRTWSIAVDFPSGYRVPAEGRTLTIRTDDAAMPTLRVPVRSAGAHGATSRRAALALVGQRAPEIALETRRARAVSNESFTEHNATVLNFFAPNCPYCRRQIPAVETVRTAFADRGVRFVNVAETMGGVEYGIEATMDVLASLGAQLEVAADAGNEVGQRFRATGLPTLFVVDRRGTVRWVAIGARENLEETLVARLQALLAE